MPSWFISASNPDDGGQIIYAGTYYNNIFGATYDSTLEVYKQIRIRDTYTLSKMYVRIPTNEQTGTSTVTSRKNGADGNMSISIGAGLTGAFTDDVNSDNLVSGDLANVKVVTLSDNNLWISLISHKLYSSSNVPILATTGEGGTYNSTFYSPVGGLTSLNTAAKTETNSRYRFRIAATMSNFRVYVGYNSLNGASTARTRKNSTNGNQSVSIPAATTGDYEDTTYTDSIVSGDRFNYQIVTGGTSGSFWTGMWQVKSTCTARHVMNYDNAASESWPSSTTYYIGAEGIRSAEVGEATVEAAVLSMARCDFNAKNLYCNVAFNDLSGSTSVKLRKNGADSTLAISISGGSTGEFEDTTNTVAFVATDTLNWKIITGADGADEIGIVGMGFQLEPTGDEPTIYQLTRTDGLKAGDSNLRSMAAVVSRSEGLVTEDTALEDMAIGLSVTEGIVAGDSRLPYGVVSREEDLRIGSSKLIDALISLSHSEGVKVGGSELVNALISLSCAEEVRIGSIVDYLVYKYLTRAEALELSDIASLVESGVARILLEDGFVLLKEDGDALLLESAISYIYLTLIDTLYAGDTFLAEMLSEVQLSDGTKFTESPIIEMLANLVSTEGITLDEVIEGVLVTLYSLSITSGLTFGDERTTEMLSSLQLSDGTKVADASIANIVSNLIRSEGLRLDDVLVLSLLANLQAQDGIKLSDARLTDVIEAVMLAITDGIKISDAPSLGMLALLALVNAIHIGDARSTGLLGRLLTMWLSIETYHDVEIFTDTYHDIEVFTEPYHCVTIYTGDEDMIRRNWQRGETVPIWATVEVAGVATNPDQGVKVTVTSPITGTEVIAAGVMTQTGATGRYVYYWNTDADDEVGWYKAKGLAQDGTGDTAKVTIEYGGFQLE